MEDLIKVAKRELSWEVDYIREAECTKKFYDLLKDFPEYKVPLVIGKIIFHYSLFEVSFYSIFVLY